MTAGSGSPRAFCQEQLLLLGDEELPAGVQEASLHLLHTTIMDDPDSATFEARLETLSAARAPAGSPAESSAQVARVLLDSWHEWRCGGASTCIRPAR